MAFNKKSLVFSIITILGTLFVSEFALQVSAFLFLGVDRLLSRPEFAREDQSLGHRPSPRHPDHDRKGFRNALIPNQPSIIAMGDSHTYGWGVSRDQAWPQQIEILSKITTYNMAFGGYGPAHSLLLLDEALDLKPELLIEAFYAGNDLYDSYSLVYDRKQLSHLKSTDESVLKTMLHLENSKPLAEEIAQLYNTVFEGEAKESAATRGALREFLADHSKVYGLSRALKRMYTHEKNDPTVFNNSDYSNSDWNAIKQHALRHREHLQIFEMRDIKTVFTPEFRLLGSNLNDPRIAEGHRISLEAIRLMRERSRTRDIGFLVLLMPTKEMVFKELVYEDFGNIPERFKRLIVNEELLWQKTKDFLARHGIYFVDALPILRECLRSGNRPYPRSLDGHPNSVGHRAIAKLVASEIKKQGLLTRRGV